MQEQTFDSSDSVRTAQPLLHARYVTFDEPLTLQRGGSLPAVQVAFETYGELNAAADNAVLVCHALSGDSHVARHDAADAPGWWDLVVGPGKAIDTDRYFVICPNILGGCRGTTGPNSVNPLTGRRYGGDFPVITVFDMVEAQRRLVDHLRIDQLRAVVGGSLGGHMALGWATRFPQRVRGTVALATSPRLTSQALAFDIIGRNAILRDPEYQGGQYYDNGSGPSVGLALARMLGHITYLSREAMMQKFDSRRLQPRDIQTQFETKFSVGSYLAHQGDKFVERFDANSYVTLTMAMDLFDLGGSPHCLAQVLRRATCRWLLLSYTSDWLFPPFQSREIVDALIGNHQSVSYCNVRTDCGHDAFLLENELATYGEMIRAFLANLDESPDWNGAGRTPALARAEHETAAAAHLAAEAPPAAVGAEATGDDQYLSGPTSIFHRRRLDYDTMVDLIPPEASVLDLGCGTGGLLARLRAQGQRRLIGLELDEQAILSCIRRGLDVIHADLNDGLAAFGDGEFDFVVLSQTLQAVRGVEQVLADMLRVGRRGVVSFPNLAYRAWRERLATEGRAPRVTTTQGFQWYDTPDVRFLTIADFEEFCAERAVQIHRRVALDTQSGRAVDDDPNLNADVAIFVVSK